jgi:uncharacterized protein YbjQ (UPF0145 family)
MLITTQDFLADKEIEETLGLVVGNTIRARSVGKDILAMKLRNTPNLWLNLGNNLSTE